MKTIARLQAAPLRSPGQAGAFGLFERLAQLLSRNSAARALLYAVIADNKADNGRATKPLANFQQPEAYAPAIRREFHGHWKASLSENLHDAPGIAPTNLPLSAS